VSGDQSFIERVLRDIADIKVSMARIEAKTENISDRIEVINHNTTDNAQRLAILEKAQTRTTDFSDFAKRAMVTFAGVIGVAASLALLLNFLGLHI